MPIPEDVIQRVLQQTNIVEVIQERVPLEQVYLGKCPFHKEEEHFKSLIVIPRTGLYHCIGCGAGGNVFRFVMQTEGLSFTEAVERLRKEE
jgi:DNA primase